MIRSGIKEGQEYDTVIMNIEGPAVDSDPKERKVSLSVHLIFFTGPTNLLWSKNWKVDLRSMSQEYAGKLKHNSTMIPLTESS